MLSWCTVADVKARIAGSPSDALVQEYANEATGLLFILSGRKFVGAANVSVTFQADRRGYINLTDWAPVNSVVSAVDSAGASVSASLSPGGTYVILPYQYREQLVTVTINAGANPPPMAVRAAAALAADMLREDPRYATSGVGGSDPGDVRMSSRLTSIARQGVTFNFANISDLAKDNLTGIYEVDMFLRAVNPNRMRYQPKVVTA